MNYTIQDNYLSEDALRIIQDVTSITYEWKTSKGMFNNEKLLWSLVNVTLHPRDPLHAEICEEKHNFYFVHSFWGNNGMLISNMMPILGPILDKINPKALLRIRGNLYTNTSKIVEHGLHYDYPFECMASIFHVNTNDGYTKFEDGTIVESVANRLVTFSSSLKHTGTTCTDVAARVNINFNYF